MGIITALKAFCIALCGKEISIEKINKSLKSIDEKGNNNGLVGIPDLISMIGKIKKGKI